MQTVKCLPGDIIIDNNFIEKPVKLSILPLSQNIDFADI